LLNDIREKKSLTDEIKADLEQVLKDFKDMWNEKRANDAAELSRASAATTDAPPASVSA
jgi:hypothetical protein